MKMARSEMLGGAENKRKKEERGARVGPGFGPGRAQTGSG